MACAIRPTPETASKSGGSVSTLDKRGRMLRMNGSRAVLWTVCLIIVTGCTGTPPRTGFFTPTGDGQQRLLRVEHIVQQRWQELVLRGRTDYRVTALDERLAVRAEGRNSASGLIREVGLDVEDCPELTWSWRVDKLQPEADIRVKGREDVAASIFLLFGDPGMLALPDPVPTLRYVWTNAKVEEETIVDNPNMPGIVRSLVVRSGDENLGAWVIERRNIYQDFVAAFDHEPEDELFAVALFTDNDQTGQSVLAFYEWIAIRCGR